MSKKKIIISAILGNVVEYYDFGVYAVFASTIGALFFPSASEFVQLALAFSVFAFGFLMRPLGGIIFGHIGDKFGRKVALNLSILGMAISTLSIGILPGYEKIGILAPIILVIIRMFQGVCIGGEGTGSAIFILEHLSKKRLSLIGSVVMASNILGTLLATLVGICITEFIGVDDFSWRYGFILGAIMGIVGVYLRHQNAETPVFDEMRSKNKLIKTPLLKVIKEKQASLLLIIALSGAATSLAYMIRGYFSTFFLEIMGYPHNQSLYFTSFCLLNLIILLPIFGMIADHFGQSRFLRFTAFVIIISIIPIFLLLANNSKNEFLVYSALVLISILAAAISAPAYPYAISAFPPELRYSGVAFGWNIGNAIFGGTTPFISTILVEKVSNIAPAYYIICTSLFFLIISQLTQHYGYQVLREKVMKKKIDGKKLLDTNKNLDDRQRNNNTASSNKNKLAKALRNNLFRRKASSNNSKETNKDA